MRCIVTVMLVLLTILTASRGIAHDRDRDDRDDHDGRHDDHLGRAVKISPSRDLVLPRSWAGEWRITTTHHGPKRNVVTAVDDVTDIIRSGEPLGLSLLTRGGLASCTGLVGDRHLQAICFRHVSNGFCHAGAVVKLTLERDRDTLVGSGVAKAGLGGRCGDLSGEHTRTTFELQGTRLGPGRGNPHEPSPPLLTRFVLSAPLLTFLATAPQVTPVVEEDCDDGAWRAFTSPAFRSEAQCLKVVRDRERHHGKDGQR